MNGRLLLVVCLVFGLVAGDCMAAKGKKNKKNDATSEEVNPAGKTSSGNLGEPVEVKIPEVSEPSGVAFHKGLGRLLVIGDEGTLTALTLDGKKDWAKFGLGDLEDVAVHEPTGLILLLSEKQSRILVFDPTSKKTIGTWKLDGASLLGQDPEEANKGFEGLAVKDSGSETDDVILFLSHQGKPARVVAVKVPMVRGNQTISRDAVQGCYSLKNYSDLTAVTWVPEIAALLVISENSDRLLVVSEKGALQAELALAGQQQEGVCLDDQGRLWVADDRGDLLRFDGALKVLKGLR